mmetsp:Transcript_34013/g.53003  ORF Transcript_34013/g.53003 Transcript_34013/m.53003 type:complete len:88 (-) Transcript_34013:1182-1445(-)
MQSLAASKRALVAGVLLLCCALALLTVVANRPAKRVMLGQVPKAWDAHWDWFTKMAPGQHMLSEGASESYYAQGMYPFDQGHPNLGN